MTRINPEIMQLQTAAGFDRQFWRLLAADDLTHEQAFCKLYEKSVAFFGTCRYKNYESYRVSRRNRLIRNR
jgi:hypothetical protein